MKLFDKKNFVKISDEDLKDAKLSTADFKNESVRKRAFINVLGARLAMNYMFSQKLEANNIYSLYRAHSIIEQFDISDIYYQGIKVDVRLVFNSDEIFIPKQHFDADLLPDVYFVFVLQEGFTGAEFLGYFEPKELDKSNANDDFYFIEANELHKPDKLKNLLDYFIVETPKELSDEELASAEELFLPLVDNEISAADRHLVLQKLSQSIELRLKLLEFENFELLSNEIIKNETMLKDGVLDIVGAQKLYEDDELESLAVLSTQTEELDESEINLDDLAQMDDLEELAVESEVNNENTSDSKLLETGLKTAAAGLGFGAALAAGAGAAAAASAGTVAATAQVQGEIVKGGAEIISSGIESGAEILSSAASQADVTADLPEIEISTESASDNDLADFADLFSDDDLPEYMKNTDMLGDTAQGAMSEQDDLSELFEQSQDFETGVDEVDNTPKTVSFDDFEQSESEMSEEKAEDIDETALSMDLDEDNGLEFEPLGELEEITSVEDLQDASFDVPEVAQDNLENNDENNVSDAFAQEEISDDLPTINFDEIEPLEDLPELQSLEDVSDESQEQIAKTEDLPEANSEVYSLDNFDFDMLEKQPEEVDSTEDETVSSSNLVSFDEIENGLNNFDADVDSEEVPSYVKELAESEDVPTVDIEEFEEEHVSEDEEQSVLEKIKEIEESEEGGESDEFSSVPPAQLNQEIQMEDSDELISQVDEFLKDIELSDETKELLANQIDIDATQESFLQDATLEGVNSDLSLEGNSLESIKSPSVQADSTDLSIADEDDSDLLKVLFEKEGMQSTDTIASQSGLDDLDNLDSLDDLGDITIPDKRAKSTKDKRVLIAASVAGVVFVSMVVGARMLSNSTSATTNLTTAPIAASGQTPGQIPGQAGMAADSTGMDAASAGASATPGMGATAMNSAQAIPGDGQADLNRDMGKAVSDAFSSDPVNTSITKVAWEVPEELAYNDSFRKYLQIAGKNLKLNLQNDLLLATEMAYSNKVIVDLGISSDGSLATSNILVSSGSKQIDKIVLQSVKETLKYLKMPSSELNGHSADATLIINF
jgi:hypothetical protein